MSKEVEFAMKYADERRMRIALETRVLSFMYETYPFAAVAERLCKALLEQDPKETLSCMKKLIAWQADIEINVLINMFFPAGKLNVMSKQDLIDADEFGELPKEKRLALEKISKDAADTVRELWDSKAPEFGISKHRAIFDAHTEPFTEFVEQLRKSLKENVTKKPKVKQ